MDDKSTNSSVPSHKIVYRLTTDQTSKLMQTYKTLLDIAKLQSLPIDLRYNVNKLICDLPVHFGSYSQQFLLQQNEYKSVDDSNTPTIKKKVKKQYTGSFNPFTLSKKPYPLDNKRVQLIYDTVSIEPDDIIQNLKRQHIPICKYIAIIQNNKTLLLLESMKRYTTTKTNYFDIQYMMGTSEIKVSPSVSSIKRDEWSEALKYYKFYEPIIDTFIDK